MKRIILMVCAIMISIMGTAFAYSDESNADAQKMLDSIKGIRYNVEAGVNFQDYSAVVSKAIIEYKKYNEKYPDSDKDVSLVNKLHGVISDYADARTVWNDAIYNNGNVVFRSDLANLIKLHPALINKIPKTDNDHVCVGYEDVLQALWSVAADDEKSLTDTPSTVTP
ncbi:MAG: hypothetical protein ABFC57_12980 [Veillonellales bacterium]